jgi:hypothetical protein
VAPNDSRELSGSLWDDEVRWNGITVGARIRDVLDRYSVPNLDRDLLRIEEDARVVREVRRIVRTEYLRENDAGELADSDGHDQSGDERCRQTAPMLVLMRTQYASKSP